MNKPQVVRIVSVYAAAITIAFIMILANFGGALPALILIGAVLGALQLCLASFEFSDIFGSSGRREVIPPEPDYVVTKTTKID